MTLPPALQHALVAFIVLNALLVLVAYVTLLERKFAARMQSRIGPYYVGRPHGWLQPIADALKLMMKEDVVPTASDRWVYNLAPIVFLVPCLLIFATIPFAPELGVADLNIGVLFFLAVSSLEIVGLFMGGWGSNNKYALLSAMRAVNQIISYDLPFIFAALVPVLLAGSMQMSAIVSAQQGLWFIAYPVIGQLAFLAFLVATLAAENRVPFDILEAESELVAGFRVEYSGMKFALIQLGEYAHMLGTSFLGALLFLGGCHLGAVVVREDPGRSDPGDLLEALDAGDAGHADGDRAGRRAPRARWAITAIDPRRASGGRRGSSCAPSRGRWASRCGTCSASR
jgi:NADH-quinone oxidoreductase subunit H